ncbi:MAG: FGGY family carbohydrate kinase [Actinomycetes bacterium]
MALVLGVEMSTLSTKIEVRDADDGKLLVSGQAPHAGARLGPARHDPRDWWQALVDARRDAGGALGVNAIAVAAQSDGLVLLDHEGGVLTPALIGTDPAMEIDADWLVRDGGGRETWAASCGAVPDPSHAVVKLACLRNQEPELFPRIGSVLLPHDYLTWRMARRFVTDRGDASATGYWSPREGRWRPDVLRIIDDGVDWSRVLPEVLGPGEAAGDREGVTVAPGTGAQPATALGIGMRPGDVVIALDRSGTCFASRERLTADPTGRVADRADANGRFLPTVRTFRAREVFETLAAQVGLDPAHVDQLALQAPAGAGGVRFVPFRDRDDGSGRRPDVGFLAGLTADTGQEHVARALVEGVVCSLLAGIDRLETAGVPVSGRLWVIGGAARSNAFQRVVADLAQRPVSVPKVADAVCLGATMQAASVIHGCAPDVLAPAWGLDTVREVDPDPSVDAAAIRSDYARAG